MRRTSALTSNYFCSLNPTCAIETRDACSLQAALLPAKSSHTLHEDGMQTSLHHPDLPSFGSGLQALPQPRAPTSPTDSVGLWRISKPFRTSWRRELKTAALGTYLSIYLSLCLSLSLYICDMYILCPLFSEVTESYLIALTLTSALSLRTCHK